MVNQPLLRVPFVLLLLIMLANASYASMGDISICFPFFLLLALLMAGMIAQGRSPLVGFDISISKPPAEIKSTSYHFKSFTSGGFDTVAKKRDQLGGGNYLTRGFGWVANKMAKGAATVVSKASGGKYGSKVAKEGVKTLKTMADRGALYALSKGKRGGGYEGRIEREKTRKESEVKSLRSMLATSLASVMNLQGARNRITELEEKKKDKGLTAQEKRELKNLKNFVSLREAIREKKREHANLKLKQLRGEKLSDKDMARLAALSKEIGNLEKRLYRTKLGKDVATLNKKIREAEKKVAVYDGLIKQMDEYRKQLADVGGVIGRIKMMAYAPAAAASFAYLGVKYPISTIIVKPSQRWKLRREIRKLEEKKNKNPSQFSKEDEKKLKGLKERYDRLSQRGMLVRVFNPEQLSRKEVLKATLKGWFISSTTGFVSSLLQNVPYRVARVRYERARFKPNIIARVTIAERRREHIEKNLAMLKDPTLTPAQVAGLLRDTVEHQKRLMEDMRGGIIDRVLRDTKSKRGLTKTQKRELNILKKEIKGLAKDIEKLSKKGRSDELTDKINQFQKKIGEVNNILLPPDARDKLNEVRTQLKDLNTKLVAGQISVEEYKKKTKELDKKMSELSKIAPSIIGASLMGQYRSDKVNMTREAISAIKEKISNLDDLYYNKHNITWKEHQARVKPLEKALKVMSGYRKLEDSYYRHTVKPYLTPEHDRATWLGVERLFDMWGQRAEAAKGHYTPEALAIRGVAFAASGFQKTQNLRQIASEFENIIGPTISKLSEEEMKKQHFMRLLGKQQMEVEEKQKKLKGIFEKKPLYAKRAELKEECENLKSQLEKLNPNTKEYKAKEKELQAKMEELARTNLQIRDAKKELAKAERNVELITTHLMLNQALLAQRRLEAFDRDRDEVKRNLERGINTIEEKLRKDEENKKKIEDRMMKLEKAGKKNTNDYKKLEDRLHKLELSILKKENDINDLRRAIDRRRFDLQRAVDETAERTIIRVGGQKILRDREAVLSEMSILRADALEKPNPYVLGLIKTLGVEKASEVKKYNNTDKLEGEERERVKSQYEKALRATYSKLKNKWDKLETINLAEWTRRRMEEAGTSLGGSETGMHRDLIEVQAIITKLEKDKEELKEKAGIGVIDRSKLKEFGAKNIEEYEKVTKELDAHLKKKERTLSSMLYLTNLTYGQFLDPTTMDKYVKLYREIEEARKTLPETAKYELQEVNLRIRAVEAELESARKAGWRERIEMLENRKKELEAERDKLTNVLEFGELPLTQPEREKRYERLKRMEDKLERFALVMQAAELLQREAASGGLMQSQTAEILKKLREEYPEDKRKGRGFWEEARWWAGQLDRSVSENALAKYEATAVKLRNEIKGISSEISELEKKLKEKKGKIDAEAVELNSELQEKLEERREKQKELIEVCKDWKSFKDTYDATYMYAPYRKMTQWAGPGSEERIHKFIEESVDKDLRIRLGIHGVSSERATGFASKAVENIEKFAVQHGKTLLFAATVAAPFAMPFIGVGAAAVITAGAYGIYGAKTGTRKVGEWEMTGYPTSTGEEGVRRTMNKIIEWSSHLTGRGSGGPARTMQSVWESQVYGTAYVWKGLRLNRYWDIEPWQEALELPDVGLPWHIRAFKSIFEGPSTYLSYWGKRLAISAEWPGGWDELKLTMAENPRVPPEVQKVIQYQMMQMYGSIIPIPYPKQVREMLGSELGTTVAFYEPAKDVIAIRKFAYNPAGIRYGLIPRSFREERGFSIAADQAIKRIDQLVTTQMSYGSISRARY